MPATEPELFDAELPADVLDRCDDPELLRRWPQSLNDMLDVIEQAYRDCGASEASARRLAFMAMRALAQYHGGRSFYLPKGEDLDRALRDREIWERLRGNNIPELAREYRLTEVQIYNIIRTQRALFRTRHQRELFSATKP